MITVIARWEVDVSLHDAEHQLWHQLRNFGIDRLVFVGEIDSKVAYDQYETMAEALDTVTGNRVFMESSGDKTMSDLPPREEDVVFIFGRTNQNNLSHAQEGETYRIKEPTVTDMYQTCAAAIVLALWYGQ